MNVSGGVNVRGLEGHLWGKCPEAPKPQAPGDAGPPSRPLDPTGIVPIPRPSWCGPAFTLRGLRACRNGARWSKISQDDWTPTLSPQEVPLGGWLPRGFPPRSQVPSRLPSGASKAFRGEMLFLGLVPAEWGPCTHPQSWVLQSHLLWRGGGATQGRGVARPLPLTGASSLARSLPT